MHDTGIEYQFLLTTYARERFLYRLGACPIRDRFILKGASLLSVWMDEPHRATRDVDVLALQASDEPHVRQVVATICGVRCPEDAIDFDLSSVRVSLIRTGQEQPSQRVKLVARLGESQDSVSGRHRLRRHCCTRAGGRPVPNPLGRHACSNGASVSTCIQRG